jgi:hypothetical protein
MLPGYRIPLPRGEYRVTLHFAEGWFKQPGSRIFDILLEGEPRMTNYEPLAEGFGMPQARTFTVTVNDGELAVDFQRRVENPTLSALAIERVSPRW